MEGSNLALNFFIWWYSEAFADFLVYLKHYFIYLADLFSVKDSILTLLAPWKRDILAGDGLSLQERFQVVLLNLSSRFIGALVKLMVLLVFMLIAVAFLVLSVGLITLWLCWPLISCYLIYIGINYK